MLTSPTFRELMMKFKDDFLNSFTRSSTSTEILHSVVAIE